MSPRPGRDGSRQRGPAGSGAAGRQRGELKPPAARTARRVVGRYAQAACRQWRKPPVRTRRYGTPAPATTDGTRRGPA